MKSGPVLVGRKLATTQDALNRVRQFAWILFSGVCGAAIAHDLEDAASNVLVSPLTAVQSTSSVATTTPSYQSQFAVQLVSLSPQIRRAAESIILRDQIWPTSRLTICFGPSQAVASRGALVSKITAIASEWTQGTGLTLDFGVPPRICTDAHSANIRVSVAPPVASARFESLTGVEAASESIAGFEPFTMLLPFPLQDNYYSIDAVMRFYVLHEFGHALGASHEHQRVDCQYDYQYIAQHFNFQSAQDARDNLEPVFGNAAQAYPDGQAIITQLGVETKYDNFSVMKYNLSTKNYPSGDDPNVYINKTSSVCYRSGWISKLTDYDRAGMRLAYYGQNLAVGAFVASVISHTRTESVDAGLVRHLSNPVIGRTGWGEFLRSNSQPSLTQTKKLAPIYSDVKTVESSPQALEVVSRVLSARGSLFQ